MPEEQETPTTEAPAEAEQPQAATPAPEPAKPEPPKQDEPDFRAAYVGLQRTVNKLHARNEDLQRQNVEIADALKTVKETTTLLATQNLGEDQVKALEERQRVAAERAAALRAAQALEASMTRSINAIDKIMASAGLTEKERLAVYAQAQQFDGPEWFGAVEAIASQRIAQAIESKSKEAEAKVVAKDAAAIRAEAEALADRKRKENGDDKIDTAKGQSARTLAQRIAEMDPNSPEFQTLYMNVVSGRVNK